MKISIGGVEHLSEIVRIAKNTWPEAYGHILSSSQIDYMLDMMYSEEALKKQMMNHHHFILIKDDESEKFIGFISYESQYEELAQTKIHKLYIEPTAHSKGLGKKLIHEVEIIARGLGDKYLILNVNRYNKALGFYQKNGFEIIDEEDIDIGNGFLMEDYILRKEL